jgi:hypothetical protein
MDPNFIIVKSPDPIVILIETFPELYTEIEDLQQDEEYGSYYVYARFAEYLASRPGDEQLWQRAYVFFEVLAKGGSALGGLLTEVFEVLGADTPLLLSSLKRTWGQPHYTFLTD